MTEHRQQDSGRQEDGAGSTNAIGRWTVPDTGAVFTMDAVLIQRLRAYVLEGFHILPKRGAEMGGILLGRILSAAPLAIEVTSFVPVPCEYRYGPSYILSDIDRTKLSLALSQFDAPPTDGAAAHASAVCVVGCFRSCTGRELALDAADQQLMRNFFPDPRQIFLSIHPSSILDCVAWFFHRSNGVLPRLPSQPPEPFGRYAPAEDRANERTARVVAEAFHEAAPEAGPVTEEPAPAHRAASDTHPSAPMPEEPAAAEAALGRPSRPSSETANTGPLSAYARHAPPAHAPAVSQPAPGSGADSEPAPRHFAARAAASAASSSAAPAGGPSVSTEESGSRSEPVLPPPIRGAGEESPASEQAWRMVERRRQRRENGGGPTQLGLDEPPPVADEGPKPQQHWLIDEHPAETRKHRLWQLLAALLVLLVGGGLGYQWWDAQQRARWSQLGLDAKPGPAGMEITWDRQAPALSEANRAVLEIVESNEAEAGATHQMELDAKALAQGRVFYPTASGNVLFRLQLYSTGLASAVESVRVVSSAGSSRSAAPAALTGAQQTPPKPDSAASKHAATPAGEKPGNSVTANDRVVSAKPVPPAQSSKEAAGDGSANPADAPPPSAPAEVIREVQPTIPEGIRARIQETITVPVQVTIDAKGHVTSAASQGDGDGLYRYLASRAATAAHSWTFRPARSQGGAAIPTTQVVYFRFRG
ncbi:hypothetical protein [uncultured Paludibaculum sp.]|uniref:hypothetical protein n=1 Tax=uncultured Paludibaculum sp. TaxID=1765020 RepID=UPI002AAA777D|nr:hypothetical protein [uncultured Paludibaculum sp.]